MKEQSVWLLSREWDTEGFTPVLAFLTKPEGTPNEIALKFLPITKIVYFYDLEEVPLCVDTIRSSTLPKRR